MITEKTKDFRPLLRKAGYKATPARLAILVFMKKTKTPLCAEDMIKNFKKDFDQATIYRTLKNLKESGIIKQIDLRHNHAHYELADIEDHHHLICTKCGRIEEVEGCELVEMYREILRNTKHFCEIRQHSLEFYGLCKACDRKKE